MDDVVDALVRGGVQLIKVGASLAAASGFCFFVMVSLIDMARELTRGDPLYRLCFGFGLALGSIGCVAIAMYVLIQWRERSGFRENVSS